MWNFPACLFHFHTHSQLHNSWLTSFLHLFIQFQACYFLREVPDLFALIQTVCVSFRLSGALIPKRMATTIPNTNTPNADELFHKAAATRLQEGGKAAGPRPPRCAQVGGSGCALANMLSALIYVLTVDLSVG